MTQIHQTRQVQAATNIECRMHTALESTGALSCLDPRTEMSLLMEENPDHRQRSGRRSGLAGFKSPSFD